MNRVHDIEGDSAESSIKRITLISDKIQEFYQLRCKISLEDDSTFLAPPSDIGEPLSLFVLDFRSDYANARICESCD